LNWAVVAQKPQNAAYLSVYEMQRSARWLAIWSALLSVLVSIYAARKITTPLRTLTEQSRAIAKGDFSRRVRVASHNEIGELAPTFCAQCISYARCCPASNCTMRRSMAVDIPTD